MAFGTRDGNERGVAFGQSNKGKTCLTDFWMQSNRSIVEGAFDISLWDQLGQNFGTAANDTTRLAEQKQKSALASERNPHY